MEPIEYNQNEREWTGASRRRLWSWAALVLVAGLAVPTISGARTQAENGAARPAAITCTGATYTVVGGDSWFKIASKHGITMAALTAANNATTSTPLYPGNVLCLPAGVSTTPTTTPATTVPASTGGVVTIQQFPVQGTCYFTDTYGAPRSGGRSHQGVDIIAASGKYLYAVDNGTLTKQYLDAAGSLSGNGWRLTRADGTYFFYAHLSAFAPGLVVGSKVTAGQILGYVGMTGNAGTPHLHFEVHPGGGAAINPTPTVQRVNGCSTSVVPAQPGPPPTTPTTTAATTTTTVAPAPTVPATTVPGTTAPVTTVPSTVPSTTVPSTPGATDGLWQFIAAVKALDTGGSQLTPRTTRRITVAGLAGVPAGTSAVMVRVAVRNISASGYLQVFACDAGVPSASTLNYNSGLLSATMTMVRVSAGEICVLASTAADLRLDVVAVAAATGVGPQAIVTKRALDTRSSTPIPAGGTRSASIGAMGIPAGSKAVTVMVTVLGPTTAGSIGVGPCGGTPWIVPFGAGANQVFSGVIRSNDSGLCVSSTEQVHVVLDVTAAWTGTNRLVPIAPQRLFDSRPTGPITPGGRFLPLVVPAGSTQAQLTIALVGGPANAALFVWNCADKPPTAAAAYTPGYTNNAVTMTLKVSGNALCLASTANVHVLVDVVAAG